MSEHGAEAALHQAQLKAVITWLEAHQCEWDDFDPDQGQDPDGYAGSAAEDRQKWMENSLKAFRSMRERGFFPLSPNQINWVYKIAKQNQIVLPEPPAPRGNEVALLFKPGLPPKPPSRW
jgi:hypothetical protein